MILIFENPKIHLRDNTVPFASDNLNKTLYFLNNESKKLEFDVTELAGIINESVLCEDVILLSEAKKDYIDSVIKYLNSSKKYINDLWSKFSLEHSLSQKENAALVGKAINNIVADGYVYSGYRYTINDENIHIDRVINGSESEIKRLLQNDGIDKEKDKASNENLDKIRGRLVGQDRVSSENFQSELKRHYRNNRTRPVDIAVDPKMKDEMIDAIFDTDQHLQKCVHLKNDIIRYIDSLISYFKNLNSIANSGVDKIMKNTESKYMENGSIKSSDVLELASASLNYHRKLISIYTIVLAAKLDAINERHRVYTKVIKHMMEENNRGE